MLFIRNRNGSHNPHEDMAIADFAAAADVLSDVCLSGRLRQ
jgi:N-carbamoyl-L-amino-acid hydrolase